MFARPDAHQARRQRDEVVMRSGKFPDVPAMVADAVPDLLAFITAVVLDAHDEWAVAEPRDLSEVSMAELCDSADERAELSEVQLPLPVTT